MFDVVQRFNVGNQSGQVYGHDYFVLHSVDHDVSAQRLSVLLQLGELLLEHLPQLPVRQDLFRPRLPHRLH